MYRITRQLSGRKANTNKPVCSKTGHMLSKPEEQLDRWGEHFHGLLKGTPVGDPPDIGLEEDLDINLGAITQEEITTAIK